MVCVAGGSWGQLAGRPDGEHLDTLTRMTRRISQRELRNENAKLMDAVAAGETFVVTRHGEPVAELRPIQSARKTFINRDDLARVAGAGVRIDRDQFRRDIDAAIDQAV